MTAMCPFCGQGPEVHYPAGDGTNDPCPDVPVRVIGLDLSITSTGIAYVDGTLDTVRSKEPGDRRLVDIRGRILEALLFPGADLVTIEDFVVRSASASILGMLHGVIRAELIDQEIPYLLVSPSTLKVYATGSGIAQKADMRMALYRRIRVDVPDEDQVDAAWLRLLGLDLAGCPEVELPQTHRRALQKLALPHDLPSAEASQ